MKNGNDLLHCLTTGKYCPSRTLIINNQGSREMVRFDFLDTVQQYPRWV